MKYKAPAVRVTFSCLPPIPYPKGFDISLLEILDQYEISDDEMKEFEGKHLKGTSLAYMVQGKSYYYRRAQIDTFLKRKSK